MEKTEPRQKIEVAPTKDFFINTLTKDVKLDSAILDLIDNSIDAYIINNCRGKKKISLEFDANHFCIEDDCGGIKKEKVYNEVFKIGILKEEKKETLGIYGIGLKRSMFKLGRDIRLESDDGKNYFSVHIDENWIKNDSLWDLDFEKEEPSKGTPFFRLNIKKLYPDISNSLSTRPFQERLIEKTRESLSMHMEKKVNIFVNKLAVIPFDFTFLENKNFQPLREELKTDDSEMRIEIIAGFTDKKDLQGWCVFCNDRMIVKNDTSYKTGFSNIYFHPTQDNDFLGMIFFNSTNPIKLPWKSTKDDVVMENRYYRAAQVRMNEITKDLVGGLSKKIYHAKDTQGETIGKSIFEEIPSKKWSSIPLGQKAKYPTLVTTPDKIFEPKYTTINYQVKIKEIQKIKKYMGNPNMTNKAVGERMYKFYCQLKKIK